MNPTHEHPQTQSSLRTTDKERRQRIPSIPYSIVKEQTHQTKPEEPARRREALSRRHTADCQTLICDHNQKSKSELTP